MDLTSQQVVSSTRPAFSDGAGVAYNERAFRYLLEIERRRARRGRRSLVLLLVRSTSAAPFPASKVFAGLSLSLREVDFCGWYRDQRVAAAVLTQGDDVPSWDACREIRARVARMLAEQLPGHRGEEIQVRVARLCPRSES